MDHFSNLGFVYLQKTASAAETIEGKQTFERYAKARGVTISAYHADNGIFKAIDWVKECIKSHQQLTYAGVGAHHQNGRAEKRIRDLQETTRTMLVHAQRRWPNAINVALWPYALRQANLCFNIAPSLQNKERLSPNQLFESHKVEINPKHWYPFGCPVYVLAEPLQNGKPFNKWKHRARVGVYLGQSPIHNRNVALVLSLETGHVSPQFHVTFDNSFHSKDQINIQSKWQQKTGFTWSPPEPKKKQSKRQRQDSEEPLTAPYSRAPKRVHFAPQLETALGPSDGGQSPQQSRASTSSSSTEQRATIHDGSQDTQAVYN